LGLTSGTFLFGALFYNKRSPGYLGLTHLLSGALFYGLWRFFVQMRF
jgi:hypothetical protein